MYQISEAQDFLLENTIESVCWQFGYHPTHSSFVERGPGKRRLTLSLIMMNNVRIFEDMPIDSDNQPSYLTLARRAVARIPLENP